MIQFVTGIPGSGKSYYGNFTIAINFNKTLAENKKFKSFALSKTKYKTCLTNINETKFEAFENVKSLNFDNFKAILTKLYNYYKLGNSDSELEELVKDEDFFYTLIVFDECHNYLSKDDEVLVWWLSYHRHFFQDIILITQDIPLVNVKYKAFSEFYYKAIPASRKLFNSNMIYQQYTGHQLFKTQKATVKKLPILKEVFELYGSGENNKQKSLVMHYVVISFFLMILVFLVFYFVIFNMSPDEEKIKSPQQTQKKELNNNKKSIPNIDGVFYEMYCNFHFCFINGNIHKKEFILKIIKDDYKANIVAKSKNKFYFFATDKFNLFEKKNQTNGASR